MRDTSTRQADTLDAIAEALEDLLAEPRFEGDVERETIYGVLVRVKDDAADVREDAGV